MDGNRKKEEANKHRKISKAGIKRYKN